MNPVHVVKGQPQKSEKLCFRCGGKHKATAGPFVGHMYLIITDTHSWLEVLPVSTATSQSTVRKMKEVFAIHGLPDEIVTDNGTSFTGTEFQQFVTQNEI